MNTWTPPEPKVKKQRTLKPWQEDQLKYSIWLEACANWDAAHCLCPQCRKPINIKVPRQYPGPNNFKTGYDIIGNVTCEHVFTELDVKNNKRISVNVVVDQQCGWTGPFEKLVSSDDNSV